MRQQMKCLCTCKIFLKGLKQSNPGVHRLSRTQTGTQIPQYKVECGKGHKGYRIPNRQQNGSFSHME